MPKRREVDQWFAKYDNPMKDVVMAIRDVILATDKRVDECIKWQAPTFTFEGNIASFFPKSKKHASLMFHQGAKIPGRYAILEGDGSTARQIKLSSLAEVRAKRKEIQSVIRGWIAWKGGTTEQVSQKKGGANKGPAKKASRKKGHSTASVGAAKKKRAAKKTTRKKSTTKKK